MRRYKIKVIVRGRSGIGEEGQLKGGLGSEKVRKRGGGVG